MYKTEACVLRLHENLLKKVHSKQKTRLRTDGLPPCMITSMLLQEPLHSHTKQR